MARGRANLIGINRLSGSLVTVANQIQISVDDGHQQGVLGMLKNLVPKLGGGPELVGGHGHRLHKEHLVHVFIVAVDFAALGNMFVLHCVQQGQDV